MANIRHCGEENKNFSKWEFSLGLARWGAARISDFRPLCIYKTRLESRVSSTVDPCEWKGLWKDSYHNFAKLRRMTEWKAKNARMSVLGIGCQNCFLFAVVQKTLTSPWLEKLLPFKLHFEVSIIIDRFILKFAIA